MQYYSCKLIIISASQSNSYSVILFHHNLIQEWELTKVFTTDGKEKLTRRRIVVRKVVYNPTEETGVAPIKYDEYDVNSPEVSQLDPEVKIGRWFRFQSTLHKNFISVQKFSFYGYFIVVVSCLLSSCFTISDLIHSQKSSFSQKIYKTAKN